MKAKNKKVEDTTVTQETTRTDLTTMNHAELKSQLTSLREKQLELNMQHSAGQLTKTHLISQGRKAIANVIRLLNPVLAKVKSAK